MTFFHTYAMKNSTILRIYSEKDRINTSPEYQRRGEIWTLEKRQLLIDSILNDYDIPKLYFHVLQNPREAQDGKEYLYAIVDGRQRLEALWKFLEGEFSLSDDFDYYKDKNVKAGSLTYDDLSKKYPKLKNEFDSFWVPIICVETDEMDLIEDMFSRLNEAVPLNAAEKRNAIGGPMAKMTTDISNHKFFKIKVKFSDKRFQHREVSVKLLYLEYSLSNFDKISDTKKESLDKFVREFKKNNKMNADILGESVEKILEVMHKLFTKNDELLRAQSIVPIYFLLIREFVNKNKTNLLVREKFVEFRNKLSSNRSLAEKDLSRANYDLLEFDRLSQQGANYAISIKDRLRIIKDFFKI